MLTFLKVKDFAIIDELQIEFEEGLNVITGETGAGKSIIINALSTLMNARVSPDIVRSNTPQAEVSGHFFCGDDEYVVRRIIAQSGRSRAFLNDNPVTMGRLEETGKRLVNIYGQNEFQHLLEKDNYVDIIDNLLSLTGEREGLAEKVSTLKRLKAETETKKREVEGREKEMYLLEFQRDEIEKAALREGEEEEVRERLKLLKDAEKIKGALETITAHLFDDEQSMHTMCRRLVSLLKPFHAIEPMEKLKGRIESLAFDVEDIMEDIKGVEKSVAFDADELEMLEGRLSHIFELKNKYGKGYGEIMAFAYAAEERLAYLSTISEDIAVLGREQSLLEKEVGLLAQVLSEKRRTGAAPIERAIVDELGFLSMKEVLFRIDVTDKGAIDEEGADDIELLISTNPGEPLKPLRKIASGGELSRIMLAIKRVIGGEEEKTLIFDEVDAGIGGRVAELVGKRLKGLAKDHQIICITHLPQIAMYGDHHFLVEKRQEGDGTKTGIRALSRDERAAEIARMIGGVTITEKTLQRAEEMLHNAEKGID
jgi:DNA repair protein RecN (Recombination protein N)